MNAHQAYLESPRDADDDFCARSEAREHAARMAIESDAERMANAVSDYYDDRMVFNCDGHDLLTEFTLALAGAERLMDIIAHDDPLPDSELQAFRALCRQVEEAKRRMALAVSEAVEREMAA